MPPDRLYGDFASKARSLLNEEQQKLYDWFTAKVVNSNDATFYSSLLQAVACQFPTIGYWNAVKTIQALENATPDWAEVRRIYEREADKNLAKKTE